MKFWFLNLLFLCCISLQSQEKKFANNTQITYTLEVHTPNKKTSFLLMPGEIVTLNNHDSDTTIHFIPGNPKTNPLAHLPSKHIKNNHLKQHSTFFMNPNNQITAYPIYS